MNIELIGNREKFVEKENVIKEFERKYLESEEQFKNKQKELIESKEKVYLVILVLNISENIFDFFI